MHVLDNRTYTSTLGLRLLTYIIRNLKKNWYEDFGYSYIKCD